MNWYFNHVALDGDGVRVGLAFCHLWFGQRLEFGLDEVDLFHTTVECQESSIKAKEALLHDSSVSLPTDGAHSLSIFGTARMAAAVPFDEASGADARKFSRSISGLFQRTSSTILKRMWKAMNGYQRVHRVNNYLFFLWNFRASSASQITESGQESIEIDKFYRCLDVWKINITVSRCKVLRRLFCLCRYVIFKTFLQSIKNLRNDRPHTKVPCVYECVDELYCPV